MEEAAYMELVVRELHRKTSAATLTWTVGKTRLSAEAGPIEATIKFKDQGSDSAIWDMVVVTNPVGTGITFLRHPSDPLAKYGFSVSSETLRQLDELFDQLVLEPRRKQFEAALAELRRA